MSRGKNLPASVPKVDVLAKDWFIIEGGFVLRVPLGTLVNLATEYGLVCPLVGCFNFERGKTLIFKLFGRQSHRKAVIM
jgi:hypothetical protein